MAKAETNSTSDIVTSTYTQSGTDNETHSPTPAQPEQSPTIPDSHFVIRTSAESSNSQENILHAQPNEITPIDYVKSISLYTLDYVKTQLPKSQSGWHLYTDNDIIQLSNKPPDLVMSKYTKICSGMCMYMEILLCYILTMTSFVSILT